MPGLPAASPVFVDPTGRRRRTIRRAAVLGVCTLLGLAGLIVAALLGAPLGPLNPLPEPVSGPAAVEPAPAQQPAIPPGEESGTTTSSSTRPGAGRVNAPVTTTTTQGAAPTTSTTTKGNKPVSPPGKPTDLPTPPSHTR